MNTKTIPAPVITKPTTHEGGPVKVITPYQELRRSVLATLLWENGFYESGLTIADRVASLSNKVNATQLADLAVEAREQMKLRHMPLLLGQLLVKHAESKNTPGMIADTLARIVQRPDELGEFLSMYWGGKKTPIAAQVKKGLARAFTKFDEYQLSKWNREADIKLRDVLFLVHAKPKNYAQADLWKRLIDGTLEIPYTWEVEISAAGKDNNKKIIAWEELLKSGKLPAMALIRNLRNMQQAGVSEKLIREAIIKMKVERVLPFRFITAAKYARSLEDVLETAMLKCLDGMEKLPGKTVLLIDVSGSMFYGNVSKGSEMTFMDAANGIAILAREVCEQAKVYSFSNDVKEVAPRRGFALRDAIVNSQSHGGTALGRAIDQINAREKYDRLIVFTDEQSQDRVGDPKGRGYIINVANAKNGVGYGKWVHIDGFSEATIKYIQAYESFFSL